MNECGSIIVATNLSFFEWAILFDIFNPMCWIWLENHTVDKNQRNQKIEVFIF